jgi:hypothetical protein
MVVERVKEKLKHVNSKISMMFDSWTSLPGHPFLSLTAHYIDSPTDKPQEWELKMEQLAFTPIRGNHSGVTLGPALGGNECLFILVSGDIGSYPQTLFLMPLTTKPSSVALNPMVFRSRVRFSVPSVHVLPCPSSSAGACLFLFRVD